VGDALFDDLLCRCDDVCPERALVAQDPRRAYVACGMDDEIGAGERAALGEVFLYI
jgi:hypothetical protein